MKRILALLSAVVLSVLSLCGCGKKENLNLLKAYKLPESVSSVKSGIVAENDNLELTWDLDRLCVIVKNKQSGDIWSTIPYDFYASGKTADAYKADGICSAIRVTYLDAKNKTENEINTNSDLSYINAQKSDTGIRLTYYFDKANISVPITFILEDDCLSVSVENALMTEGENKILRVSLLPFFVSAVNDERSYLFAPSGSGALMYTDDTQRQARKYTEQVYGKDASAQTIYEDTETESIRMPVFGAKSEDKGIFAIIAAGAETAEISAVVGDAQYGFSGIYPTFYMRGSASSLVKGSANTNNDITKYSEDVVKLSKCTVKYYLLGKENNDYNGMAECYRDYLEKNSELKQSKTYADAIITMLGGIEERKLFLGVPYHTLSSVTNFTEAQNILSDILKNTDSKLAVNLKGFGSSGLDYGEAGGGFAPDKAFGGIKGLKTLSGWAEKNKTNLFFNLDTVFLTESASNFKVRGAAVSANDVRARYCDYNIVTREQSDTVFAYLTNRLTLAKSASVIAESINKSGVKGAGLSTLTSVAYSDYASPDYYCKAHMSDDVTNILNSLAKKGISTLGEQANGYAAGLLDYVYHAPVSSSKYYALDEDIPFYQMVFGGFATLSGEPVNLSSEPRTAFLETAATGSALSFSLCNNYNDTIFKSPHSAVAMSVYAGISDTVNGYINELKPLLAKLRGARLISYTKEGELSVSRFDNGVTVIVNYGEKDIETELGRVKSMDFIFGREA